MSLAVNVITGFLGSGKTTLLKRLLSDEALGETALLINEFGEIGIDHLLVEEIAPGTVLLPSGCVCCSIRGDLKAALLDLHGRRSRSEIPPFRRVLLETTGLAAPAPILATLTYDTQLRGYFHLGLLITVVDAEHAALQERLHSEWLSQVSAADRLLISKDDRVDEQVLAALRERLAALNPAAPQALARDIGSGNQLLLGEGLKGQDAMAEIARWRLFAPQQKQHGAVDVCCLSFDQPLDWMAFGVWLSMLLRCHGERILRVKGILDVTDFDNPVAIHGVQHCLHPPVHLAAWPDAPRLSQLIFIARDLDTDSLRRSFNVFLRRLGQAP